MDFMNKGFGEAESNERANSLYAAAVAGFGEGEDGAVVCQMCETKNPAGATICSYCGNDLASDEYVTRRIAARIAAAEKARQPIEEQEETAAPPKDDELVLDALTKERILGAIAAALALDGKAAPAEEPTEEPAEALTEDTAEEPTEESLTADAAADEAVLAEDEALAEEASLTEEAAADIAEEAEVASEEEVLEACEPETIAPVIYSKRELRENLKLIQKGEGFTYAVTPPPDSFCEYAEDELPEAALAVKGSDNAMLSHCLMVIQDDVDCLLHWMRETGGQFDLYDPIPLLDEIKRAEAYLPKVFVQAGLCRAGDAEAQDALLRACNDYLLKGYKHCMDFRDNNRELIVAVKNYYRMADKETKKGGI